jgi:hypothetical protein
MAVLQCTSSLSITTTIIIIITTNRIRQNMFAHMQRHASGEKKGKRVDLSSVLHLHVCTQNRFIIQ